MAVAQPMQKGLGWRAAAVAVAVSALIAAIGIRSIVLVTGVRRGARRAEQPLRRAGEVVRRPLASGPVGTAHDGRRGPG